MSGTAKSRSISTTRSAADWRSFWAITKGCGEGCADTVTRTSNGNVVHYAAPTTRTEPITVAPNSQSTNLSFLEQMTPAERERYYKTIRLQNTQRVEVDVRRH